ncbi:MAG: AI-2E family transporter [Candidatus Paceibacterota bacterium]|jgi:predicted PurR-regulated permease PerM
MQENNKNIRLSISNDSIVRVILIGLVFYAAFKLTNLILIILTSIVIASFVVYAVSKMNRYIKNRTASVIIIYVISIALIVGLLSVFVPVFITEMSDLVGQLSKYIPNSSILNSFQVDTISGAKTVVSNISHNASLGDVVKSTQNLVESLSGGFFSIFGTAFGGMLNLLLIFIISFYLSITEKGIENFLRIVTPDVHKEYLIGLWQRTERKIGLWMQGQMLMGVIVGVLAYLGLTIIGVKYSLVLALMVIIAELVPFGLVIATIPALLFAYLDGGVTIAAITLGFYLILGQFETYLIYPLIVKRATGISPLVVILSVLIGAELAGIWGVFLAVPMAVCLIEFFDDLEKKKILARGN